MKASIQAKEDERRAQWEVEEPNPNPNPNSNPNPKWEAEEAKKKAEMLTNLKDRKEPSPFAVIPQP